MEFNELGVQISLTSYYFQIFRPCEIKPDLPAKKNIDQFYLVGKPCLLFYWEQNYAITWVNCAHISLCCQISSNISYVSFILCIFQWYCHAMNVKISEENIVLIQMFSLMFNIAIILLNICYLLFSCVPNEVHPEDSDTDYWLKQNNGFSCLLLL